MKKLLLICLMVLFVTTGCKPKSVILFNNHPITKETILNNSREFKMGKRIYYIFLTPKEITSKYIRVQIVKKDTKIEYWGYAVVYANDFKVMKDQMFYYNDYIVMNEAGYYVMQIFSKDNLTKPMAMADFWVRD